jgi:hypothetical protein
MVNPFREDARARQVVSTRDKARMYMMGGLFVVVVGAFLAARLTGPKEEVREGDTTPRSRGGLGNVDVAPEVDENGNPVIVYSPASHAEQRDLLQDTLLQGFTKLVSEGKLVDSMPADDPAVLWYVYHEAFNDYRVFAVPPAFYERLDVAKLSFEPGPWRGRFMSAFGRVLRHGPAKTIPAGPDGKAETLYGVLFEDDDGALVEAYGAWPITRAPGEWIQAYGIFYRLRPMEREGVKQDALCLFLVKPPEEAFPPIVVSKLDPEWSKEVRERTFDEANNVYERPFWLTLNYAKNLGLEGYEKLKAEPGFEVRDFGRLARDLVRTPDEFRFRFVSAVGRITDVVPDFLPTDNEGKIDRAYCGILVQPENYFVRVISPRPFSEWGLTDEEPFVRVEGVFYKAWQFVPSKGGNAYMIPLVIVTGIYFDNPGSGGGLRVVSILIAIIGLAVIGLFVCIGLRDRQGLREFQSRYRERQQSRRGKKASGAPPADGPPPPADDSPRAPPADGAPPSPSGEPPVTG